MRRVERDFLQYLTSVIEQKRHYYEFAIGCTGGRHRSVVFVEHLAKILRQDPRLDVMIYHRDIDKFVNQE
jgi:UPF0042 nucleotide-binding protein